MRLSLALAILLLASAAQALGLAPTRAELDLATANQATVDLRIDGRADAETLIDLSLAARDNEALPDGDGDGFAISVQPPQLVIPAGGSGRVRVTAQRRGALARSRSFYLVVEHLAVRDGAPAPTEQQVDFLTRIHLPVHVAGSGVPTLDWRVVHDGENRMLRLANNGQRYQRLSALEVRLPMADEQPGALWLDGAALARRAGSDALLPGQRLHLSLDDNEVPSGQISLQPSPELPR